MKNGETSDIHQIHNLGSGQKKEIMLFIIRQCCLLPRYIHLKIHITIYIFSLHHVSWFANGML